MADRFPGEIHIGGTLRPADHNQDDIDAFLAECAGLPTQWGESGPGVPLTLETIGEVMGAPTRERFALPAAE